MFVQLTKEFMGKKVGERIDVSEADAKHLTEQGIAHAVADDLVTPAVQKAMETAFNGFSKGLDTVVTEALKQFQTAQASAKKHGVPAIFGDGNDGDPHGKSFGDWLVCVAKATGKKHKEAGEAVDRLEKFYGSGFSSWQKAAMAEGTGSTGGYIVPPDFYSQILAIAAEEGSFRQRAFVQQMGSATMPFSYLNVTTAQASGNSPFFGGVIAYWNAEAVTRTETEPTLKMMELSCGFRFPA